MWRAPRGRVAGESAVFGDSIVASISGATWMRHVRAARVRAGGLRAGRRRPRPGIARRDEPPVTWISVPPPDSRSADAGREETKACSATGAQRGSSTVAPPRPAAEAAVAAGGAPTVFTIRLGGRARRGPAEARPSASGSLASGIRARRARAGPRSPRRAIAAQLQPPGGGRRWLRRGCAPRDGPQSSQTITRTISAIPTPRVIESGGAVLGPEAGVRARPVVRPSGASPVQSSSSHELMP